MRIVGGVWRGRRLAAPEGRETRPTTDRLRESLASMVLSARDLDLSGARILDAFAGSGALGLELLSRGAEHALFIERSARAVRAVERNVRELKAPAIVVAGDAWNVLERPPAALDRFDIVLLDPPYRTSPVRLGELVGILAARGMLVPGALVVHERSSDALGLDARQLAEHGLRALRTRTIGQSAIDLWRYDGASRDATAAS